MSKVVMRACDKCAAFFVDEKKAAIRDPGAKPDPSTGDVCQYHGSLAPDEDPPRATQTLSYDPSVAQSW